MTDPTQIAKDLHSVLTTTPAGQRVQEWLRRQTVDGHIEPGSDDSVIREWLGARRLVLRIEGMVKQASEGRT